MPIATGLVLTALAAGAIASQTDGGIAGSAFDSAKDIFSPEPPPVPETPDPVAQQSVLATAQAEERSLINRAGLQTTKKVRSLLGREQTLGG